MCSRSQRAPALGAIIILQAVEWCPQNPATAEFEGSPSNFSSLGGDLFHLHDRESLTRTTFLGAHLGAQRCLLYPQKRTCALQEAMSALGQERTWVQRPVRKENGGRPAAVAAAATPCLLSPRTAVMSALPPKADVCSATRDVRFGPIADTVPPIERPPREGRSEFDSAGNSCCLRLSAPQKHKSQQS
jgi:hypothetical protein